MADVDDDVYELLELPFEATATEIASSYRKKALRCHPDKYPDDPVKAAMFLRLSRAYQILSDPKKKSEYDQVQKVKLEKKKRMEQMDAKRRKLREDLEASEQKARAPQDTKTESQKNMEAELAKLREQRKTKEQKEKEAEEAKRLFEEAGKVEAQMAQANTAPKIVVSDMDRTLKVKWAKSESYTEAHLRSIFSSLGEIDHVVLSGKKGLALLSFQSIVSAHDAVMKSGKEKLAPFMVTWAGGSEPAILTNPDLFKATPSESGTSAPASRTSTPTPTPSPAPSSNQEPAAEPLPSWVSEKDFESVTIMKLRQAEERKKLIEQMQSEQPE